MNFRKVSKVWQRQIRRQSADLLIQMPDHRTVDAIIELDIFNHIEAVLQEGLPFFDFFIDLILTNLRGWDRIMSVVAVKPASLAEQSLAVIVGACLLNAYKLGCLTGATAGLRLQLRVTSSRLHTFCRYLFLIIIHILLIPYIVLFPLFYEFSRKFNF